LAMPRIEDIIKTSKHILSLIEKADPKLLTRAVVRSSRLYNLAMGLLLSAQSTAKELAVQNPAQASVLTKVAYIGAHMLMFHSPEIMKTLLKADSSKEEKDIASYIGVDTHTLRYYAETGFTTFLKGLWQWNEVNASKVSETLPADVKLNTQFSVYWSRGYFVMHLGILALQIDEGLPRLEASNALVPWILSILRDMASGAIGAGSIAVLGATIGRGKTTTIYYTLRSVLSYLGVADPDAYASNLILLRPEEFFDLITAVADEKIKIPIIVIDNASAILPKQWVRIGGVAHKLFIRLNYMIDMLRGLFGAAIFVANAPDELASFVRNAASVNIVGTELNMKRVSATVFSWRETALATTPAGHKPVMRYSIASIYVYPLLKLPKRMYEEDLVAKIDVLKTMAEETKKLYEEAKSLSEEEEQQANKPVNGVQEAGEQ